MDIKLGSQEKFSFGNFLLTNTWFRVFWSMWYKKITVINRKNIYSDKPLLICANHQNAVMDALAIVGIQTRQIVWLARSDVFKNKIACSFLRFAKIMPIYRIRDGISSLGNNEAIFKKSAEVLKAKKILALFPEAQHWGFRRLRAIQKAAPRIAFLAEEMNNFDLDIHILPVGIYYEDYVKIRKNLFVNVGTPFSIKEYLETYKNNPNQGYLELRQRIQDEMKSLILDIKHEDETYEAYDELRFICQETTTQKIGLQGNKETVRHYAQDKVIKTLDAKKETQPEKWDEIISKTNNYKKLKTESNFREWIIAQDGGDVFMLIWNCLKLIVGIPIFIIGFATNILKYSLINHLAKKMAKDVMFHNSIKFALGFILFAISYAILSAVGVAVFDLAWWYFFIIFVLLQLCAVITFEYCKMAKKTFYMFRYAIMKAQDSDKIARLLKERTEIIKDFKEFIK